MHVSQHSGHVPQRLKWFGPDSRTARVTYCVVLCCVSVQDGQFELAPTCGWYYSLGQKVQDSQGFVCQCETGLIWDSTFGTNTQRT